MYRVRSAWNTGRCSSRVEGCVLHPVIYVFCGHFYIMWKQFDPKTAKNEKKRVTFGRKHESRKAENSAINLMARKKGTGKGALLSTIDQKGRVELLPLIHYFEKILESKWKKSTFGTFKIFDKF